MPSLEALTQGVEAELRRLEGSRPLWPLPYCQDSPEAAYRFLTECVRTRIEKTGEARAIPDKEYIRWVVHEWWGCKKTGRHLIIWKSRRLVLSWIMRALDVWDIGITPGDVMMGARVYEGKGGAKEFVWRCWYIYDQLAQSFPNWNLKEPLTEGNVLKGEIDKLVLPNGGVVIAVNSERDSFKGGGARRAVTEELGDYRQVNEIWSQAMFVTQGPTSEDGMPTGEIGGHAVAISNTSPNTEFKNLKQKAGGKHDRNTDAD